MKTLLLCTSFFVICHIAAAQEIGVGLKGGLNFPNTDALAYADGIDISDAKNASGYHVGAFAKIKLAKIAIQPELLYSFQRLEYDLTNGLGTFDVEQEITYLTVPVMLRYYLVAGLNLQVGPQFGFNLDSKQTDRISGAPTTTDIKDNLKGADLSLGLGAGIDLPFGLDLHGRYVLGLTDVNDLEGSSTERNSVIQISIAYSFFGVGG